MTDATIPRPLACVIYAAKSSEDHRGSIPDQLRQLRAAVERDGGREIVAEHHDEAASAYRGSRGPGLAAARELVERLAGERDGCELWVLHSDRLARGDGATAAHLVEYVLWALKSDGRIVLRSVEDDDACKDMLYAVVNGQRNHEDSKRKSAATRAGKRRRFESGKAHGGPLNEGYALRPVLDADGRPVLARDGRIVQERVPCPDRAPIVHRIHDMIEAGHTPGEVARALNAEGIRTRRGKPWRARTIRDIVSNPFYAGYVALRDEKAKVRELREGDHEPLIERERWKRIQEMIRRMDPVAVQRRRGGRPTTDPYLLRGIVSCGACGAPMYATPRRSGGVLQRGYRCRDAVQMTGICRARWIRAEVAERYVLRYLDRFIADIPAWLTDRLEDRAGERDTLVRALDRAHVQLAELERQVERFAGQWRRWAASGDEPKADLVLGEVERAQQHADAQRREVALAEARLGEWSAPADLDAALDFYNELVELIRGSIGGGKTVDDVRAALRKVLNSAQLTLDQEGMLRGIFHLDGRFLFTEMRDEGEAMPAWLAMLQTERDTFV